MQTQDLLLLLSLLHGAMANQDLWWLDKGVFRDANSSPDISINQRNNNNNNNNNRASAAVPRQEGCGRKENCRNKSQKSKPQRQRNRNQPGN